MLCFYLLLRFLGLLWLMGFCCFTDFWASRLWFNYYVLIMVHIALFLSAFQFLRRVRVKTRVLIRFLGLLWLKGFFLVHIGFEVGSMGTSFRVPYPCRICVQVVSYPCNNCVIVSYRQFHLYFFQKLLLSLHVSIPVRMSVSVLSWF